MCLASCEKLVQLEMSYWYPSTIRPLLPTMTNLVLREVLSEFHKVLAHTPNALSTNTWCSDHIHVGTLVFAGQSGGGTTGDAENCLTFVSTAGDGALVVQVHV